MHAKKPFALCMTRHEGVLSLSHSWQASNDCIDQRSLNGFKPILHAKQTILFCVRLCTRAAERQQHCGVNLNTKCNKGALTDKISSTKYWQGRGNVPLEEQLEATSLSSVATITCNTHHMSWTAFCTSACDLLIGQVYCCLPARMRLPFPSLWYVLKLPCYLMHAKSGTMLHNPLDDSYLAPLGQDWVQKCSGCSG